MQHGSILLDFDPEILSKILLFPECRRDIVVSRLAGKVTSLKHLGVTARPEELAEAVVFGFEQLYDISFELGELSPFENRLAIRLMHEKYRSEPWNFKRGTTQKYNRIWAD